MQYKKISHSIIFSAVLIAAGLFIWGAWNYRRDLTEISSSEETIQGFELTWEGTSYKGTYEGEITDSIPYGEGSFTSQDGALSYQGSWYNGLPDGRGTFLSQGGIRTEGEFRRGARNGLCRDYSENNFYAEALYDRDIPYGNVCSYSDGALVKTDLLVNSVHLEMIKETAAELTPEIVKKDSKENRYIFFEGTVDTVYEKEDQEYYLIYNEQLGLVLGSHDNQGGNGSKQAFLPNLQAGDRVKIYGYYDGQKNNYIADEMKGYGFLFPVIRPVYGELLSDKTAADSYAHMQKQPYMYYGKAVEDVYVIDHCLKKGKTYYIWARNKAENSTDAVYVLVYQNEDKQDLVFMKGKEINIRGYFSGQYKEEKPEQNYTCSFVMYPEINICDLT